jgi:hypothetical protein
MPEVEGQNGESLKNDWERFSAWSKARPEVRTFLESAQRLRAYDGPLTDDEIEQLEECLTKLRKAFLSDET